MSSDEEIDLQELIKERDELKEQLAELEKRDEYYHYIVAEMSLDSDQKDYDEIVCPYCKNELDKLTRLSATCGLCHPFKNYFKLKEQLKDARETLAFYGDSGKWQDVSPKTGNKYREGEGVFYSDDVFDNLCEGGKRARAFLERWKDD